MVPKLFVGKEATRPAPAHKIARNSLSVPHVPPLKCAGNDFCLKLLDNGFQDLPSIRPFVESLSCLHVFSHKPSVTT